MKHLFTICPICSSQFYREVHENPEITVVCPYCRHTYTDRVGKENIKEVDYYWELYNGLYPPIENNLGDQGHLTINGLLQTIALPFLLIPLFSLLSSGHSEIGLEDFYMMAGVIFAGFIFIAISCAGIISSVKAHSFAISLTGAIFMILCSLIVIILLNSGFYTGPLAHGLCYGVLIPIAISSFSLSVILKNKKAFSTGY